MSAKIGEIQITNFKKIKSLNVSVNGGHVFVMGKNGTGKTSFIQALYSLLTGKELPPNPITTGEHRGVIKARLFDDNTRETVCIAELSFTDKNPKGKLSVKTEDGNDVIGGPRTFLDKLTKNLLFDPFEFISKTPKEQVKAYKQMFDINFDKLDIEYKEVWDSRAEINKEIKSLEGSLNVEDIKEHELKLFTEKKDLTEINEQIKNIENTNKAIRVKTAAKAEIEAEITQYKATIDQLKHKNMAIADTWQSYENIKEYLVILEERCKVLGDTDVHGTSIIKNLKNISESIEELKANSLANQGRAERGQEVVKEKEKELAEINEFLAKNKELSISELNEKYQAAITFNQKVDKVLAYKNKLVDMDDKVQISKQKTARINEINEEKRRLIAEKGIPVPGLTLDFENDQLMYNGLPFDESQISKSKIISVGIELMMATNPELRICRIKDGSLLDNDTRQELLDIIQQQGFQAFIELVEPEKQGLEVSIQEVE